MSEDISKDIAYLNSIKISGISDLVDWLILREDIRKRLKKMKLIPAAIEVKGGK